MTILDQLAEHAWERIAEKKSKISLEEIRKQALAFPRGDFAFENALKKEEIAFICECKKASPSKGLIAPDFPYLEIAREYEEAGADCISVLTEPKWFLGKDDYLREIASTVSIPCIRSSSINLSRSAVFCSSFFVLFSFALLSVKYCVISARLSIPMDSRSDPIR